MTGKRLLLAAPSAYALSGVATWIDYLAPGLRDLGWRPALALTRGVWHDADAYLAGHPFAPVTMLDSGAGTQAARVRHAARALAEAEPDIVVVVNLPDVALAVRRLRRRGGFPAKLVIVEHGLSREALIDLRQYKDTVDAYVATNRLAIAVADAFAGLAPARVFYAPYGVAPPPTEVAPAPRDASSTLRLVYAGRLDRSQKRVHDLVDLADELRRRGVAFRLSIAGGGPEEAPLRARFAAGPHEVEFLGVVAPQDLCGTVFRNADALVIPSSLESGPLVAFEAMAAGVPVVVSRFVGSQREAAFVDDENCLMFPIGDMRAAAEAISRLRDPALAGRLVEAGAALVRGRYTQQRSVARWSEVLEEVLALPALPRPRARERLKASGRLERWLGPRLGERINHAMGRVYRHREPGGEWPHLLEPTDAESETFAALVQACEAGA